MPVFWRIWRWDRILAIYNKQVRCRLVAPLEPGIDIHVFLLIVVLHIGSKIQRIGKSDIHFWADQCKPGIAVRCRQAQIGIICVDSDIDIGLKTIAYRPAESKAVTIIIIATKGAFQLVSKYALRLG